MFYNGNALFVVMLATFVLITAALMLTVLAATFWLITMALVSASRMRTFAAAWHIVEQSLLFVKAQVVPVCHSLFESSLLCSHFFFLGLLFCYHLVEAFLTLVKKFCLLFVSLVCPVFPSSHVGFLLFGHFVVALMFTVLAALVFAFLVAAFLFAFCSGFLLRFVVAASNQQECRN